jgi:hypothetical protein
VEPKPLSPRFVSFIDKIALAMPWLGLSLGLGMVGIAIWGFRACHAIARSYALPGAGANPVVVIMSWLLLFLPIAIVGVLLSGWVLGHMQMDAAEKRVRVHAQAPVPILPPPSIFVDQIYVDPPGPPLTAHVPQPVHRERLDDATTRRLDEIADRAARIFNVGVGLFFLISGLLAFLMMWIDSHQRVQSGMRPYSFPIRLLLGCGFLTFMGARILLRVSRKDTAWLAPLKVFTTIVSVRAAAEELKRKHNERTRLGPG